MDFKDYILKYKEKVYSKICDYLPDKEPRKFYEMVRCYVDRKGQYRRPSFILLWCELYGGSVENAILPAAVQQASEDWILMHDDFEDNNSLRRGLPSAHVLYGAKQSLNAGDALHMINWKMAKDASEALGDDVGVNYFKKFFDMMIVTAEGQYKDMSLTDLKDITKFTRQDYYDSIYSKSAYYSIQGPMETGVLITGNNFEKVKEYAIPAGNAFQLFDDILDVTADEKKLGKTVCNDIMDGVKTLILWNFIQDSKPSDLEKVKKIYEKQRGQKTSEEILYVKDKFIEYGSVEKSKEEGIQLAENALEKFNRIEKDKPENDIKETARNSIGYLVKREK